MANLLAPRWVERDAPDGFRARRARLGGAAGATRLGASLWEVPPGEAAYPYHFHLGDEEVLVVLAGSPVLRAPDGERTLAPGEVVAFPTGEGGAHGLRNDGETAVRFLALSTSGHPDIVVYPDSDKLSAAERRPDASGLSAVFRRADAVDYWDGETA